MDLFWIQMPPSQPLKIAVLHYQPAGEPLDPVVQSLLDALKELGHTATEVAVHDRVFDILDLINKSGCDLVFNVCETFAGDYRMEVNVAALMEMGGVKYTGSGMAGLLLAQDKILAKQLLEYHEIPTPEFAAFDGETFEMNGMLGFPMIVKPSRSDASIGIGKHSVVKTWDELTDRVRKIRRELGDEALAEEFIEGREVYVGVLGDPKGPEVLQVVELDFGKWDESQPKVSDREVKFGPETAGSPRLVMAKDIPPELAERINRAALLAYRALKVRDYARIDFRISNEGEVFVLEVNPNPYLEAKSELAMASAHKGLSYTQMVGRIVDSAAARYGLLKKQEKPSPSGEHPKVSEAERAAIAAAAAAAKA
ncbi:MAG: ATP-grasp domain-containing protein [Myxococcaceae bacterium]